MAQQWPDWTLSLTQWALLRDQLTATSHPSLSHSTQTSSYLLLALCTLSLLLHPCSIWLTLSQTRAQNSRRRLILGHSVSGYHLPHLALVLPSIFFLHALLNVASMASFLLDAHRLKFKGRTMALQDINYSLLLSAGVFTTWALACGLPPMHIGVCGPPSNGGRRSIDASSFHPRKTLTPSRFNLIGYSSILMTFLIPLPCILLTTKFTDEMNILDDSLLVRVNEILENTDRTADLLIDQALKTINQLDHTSRLVFFHTRMLSAIHLFFALLVLSSSVLISASILRPILRTLRNKPNDPSNPLRRFQKNSIHHHRHDQLDGDTTTTSNPSDRCVADPKPALMVDSISHHTVELDPSNLERKSEGDECSREPVSDRSDGGQTDRSVSIRHTTSTDPALGLFSHTTVDQDLAQSVKMKKYILKIKYLSIVVSISCLSFIVLNFCLGR